MDEDIVVVLRKWAYASSSHEQRKVFTDAADEIEHLRRQLDAAWKADHEMTKKGRSMDEQNFLVELRRHRYDGGTCITCGREKNQLHTDDCLTENAAAIIDEQADEIERLRAQLNASWKANHEMMWDETIIPIAEALGVAMVDEYGENRRQFQMVDEIIKKARSTDDSDTLQKALNLAVEELFTHPEYRHLTPEMLLGQFIEEASHD